MGSLCLTRLTYLDLFTIKLFGFEQILKFFIGCFPSSCLRFRYFPPHFLSSTIPRMRNQVPHAQENSSVSIVTRLRIGRLENWVLFPAGTRDFSELHSIQTGTGAHPASYPIGTGGSFPGIERSGHEANHSPPSSIQFFSS
jgi:hypothetical protein